MLEISNDFCLLFVKRRAGVLYTLQCSEISSTRRHKLVLWKSSNPNTPQRNGMKLEYIKDRVHLHSLLTKEAAHSSQSPRR
jgi:hypothetical protein